VKTPTQPHQGKEYLFKESIQLDLCFLKPLIISGRTTARIKRVYPAKAIHENGAWLIYCVLGGNSKYPAIGYPASIIPKKGNPSSIPPRIKIFNKILLIPVIPVAQPSPLPYHRSGIFDKEKLNGRYAASLVM